MIHYYNHGRDAVFPAGSFAYDVHIPVHPEALRALADGRTSGHLIEQVADARRVLPVHARLLGVIDTDTWRRLSMTRHLADHLPVTRYLLFDLARFGAGVHAGAPSPRARLHRGPPGAGGAQGPRRPARHDPTDRGQVMFVVTLTDVLTVGAVVLVLAFWSASRSWCCGRGSAAAARRVGAGRSNSTGASRDPG